MGDLGVEDLVAVDPVGVDEGRAVLAEIMENLDNVH